MLGQFKYIDTKSFTERNTAMIRKTKVNLIIKKVKEGIVT